MAAVDVRAGLELYGSQGSPITAGNARYPAMAFNAVRAGSCKTNEEQHIQPPDYAPWQVNWYLHEIRAPFEMKAPRDPTNPHPFGQVPALRDDGGVEVSPLICAIFPAWASHMSRPCQQLACGDVQMFESGAILAYLADAYGGLDTPQKRAAVQPWLVWANASLDPCIFVENARGQVLDTGARGKPGEVRLPPSLQHRLP